jgi:hypothetical protein
VTLAYSLPESKIALHPLLAASPDANLCGGPVHDHDGRTIGIVIAARQRGWVLVLPAATARQVAVD